MNLGHACSVLLNMIVRRKGLRGNDRSLREGRPDIVMLIKIGMHLIECISEHNLGILQFNCKIIIIIDFRCGNCLNCHFHCAYGLLALINVVWMWPTISLGWMWHKILKKRETSLGVAWQRNMEKPHWGCCCWQSQEEILNWHFLNA